MRSGFRRTGIFGPRGAVGDQPGDRRGAGVIGAEDLREEGPEGHDRVVDPVAKGDLLRPEYVLDERVVEQVAERELRSFLEEFDLVTDLWDGRLIHRRPPWREVWDRVVTQTCRK